MREYVEINNNHILVDDHNDLAWDYLVEDRIEEAADICEQAVIDWYEDDECFDLCIGDIIDERLAEAGIKFTYID